MDDERRAGEEDERKSKKRDRTSRRRGLAAVLFGTIKVKDPDEAYAEACYYIEKELHQTITPDYPVAKFMAELKMMEKDYKKQKWEMEKKSKRVRK